MSDMRSRAMTRIIDLTLLMSLAAVSGLKMRPGRTEWILWVLYLLPLFAAAILLDRRETAWGVPMRAEHAGPLEGAVSPPLLAEAREPSGDVLLMCGWCKRVPVGGAWIDLGAAGEKYRVFESAGLPMISHGICSECKEKIKDALRAGPSAADVSEM
jgi:hypothetical protein